MSTSASGPDGFNKKIKSDRKKNKHKQQSNTGNKMSRRSSKVKRPSRTSLPPALLVKPVSDFSVFSKYATGVTVWKQWVTAKIHGIPHILNLTAEELNYYLCLFIKDVKQFNERPYEPDAIFYLCLGIQHYLFENGRVDNIFYDSFYENFINCLDELAKNYSVLSIDSYYIGAHVEEEQLWESGQLGTHSPHVLLNTLIFFNLKHFMFETVYEHEEVSFSDLTLLKECGPSQVELLSLPVKCSIASKLFENGYYKPNEEDPMRCPVKIHELYLSKCPESVTTRLDSFYLLPEKTYASDSLVWYTTTPLPKDHLEKMLRRLKMVSINY